MKDGDFGTVMINPTDGTGVTGLGRGQNRHEFVTMSPVIALMLDCRFYKYNYACSNKINK